MNNYQIRNIIGWLNLPCHPRRWYTGVIYCGTRYVYRLASTASGPVLERMPRKCWPHSADVPGMWEVVADTSRIISALSGHDITRHCVALSVGSLFESGGTVSEWEVFCQMLEDGTADIWREGNFDD